MKVRSLSTLGAVWLALSVAAAPASANPALEGYSDDASFAKRIQQLDASELVQVKSLGKSLEGREIRQLTIGSGATEERPVEG